MKNFTLRENVNHLEHDNKPVAIIQKPSEAAVNAILAFSKSLEIKRSNLLKEQIDINLN